MASVDHAVECAVSNSDADVKLIVSEGDCVESDSDTDDDCEECYRHCAISL